MAFKLSECPQTRCWISVGNSARAHPFPKEIISECFWLHFRFGMSFRDVEEIMTRVVSYSPIFGRGLSQIKGVTQVPLRSFQKYSLRADGTKRGCGEKTTGAYLAVPNSSATKRASPIASPLATPLTLPFRIMFIASMPCNVRHAL